MNHRKQFCTFQLDELLFGIDVLNVQEVILPQEMTQVPLAPQLISGLINLRGQVVTAIDLGIWLGCKNDVSDPARMSVVIHTDEDIVSFLVDSIGDVLEPDESTFEPAPQTLDENVRELTTGVYKLDGQLLLVMDVQRTIELFVDAYGSRQIPAIE